MQRNRSNGELLRALGAVIGLIVVTWILTNVVGLVVVGALWVAEIGLTSAPSYVLQFLTQAVVFIGVAVAYSRYSGVSLKVRRPTIRHLGLIVLGTVALLGLAQLLGWLFMELGVPGGTNQIERIARSNPQLLLALIPIAFFLIGPSEELLFRGCVQGRLRESFGATAAIVLASLLFGLMHIPAIIANSPAGVGSYILTTFVLGLLLGSLYEYTETLVVPAFVHGLYNAILFAALYQTIG